MPRCRNCRDKFVARKFLQKFCMEKDECIAAFLKSVKEKQSKQSAKETRVRLGQIRESLMTHKDWIGLLQVVFNTFIRLRDTGKPCISCGADMKDRKGDASHFYSVGHYPSLRVDEDNCHLSCVPCNQHKGGNLHEYAIRLPIRIGQERFDALTEKRNVYFKLTIPEIQEKIADYKSKIKALKTL